MGMSERRLRVLSAIADGDYLGSMLQKRFRSWHWSTVWSHVEGLRRDGFVRSEWDGTSELLSVTRQGELYLRNVASHSGRAAS